MTSKVFLDAAQVEIMDDGLVKVDGIAACRRVVRGGVIYLQFQDRDRMRASCRGSMFVEIPLVDLVVKLTLDLQE